MSRGPGKIERAILALFDANPSATFTSLELGITICGTEPTKSQASGLLRAARTLTEKGSIVRCLICKGARGVVYGSAFDARSIALANVRAHFKGAKSRAECEALLDDPTSEPHTLAQPDGWWGLQARRNNAYADFRDDEGEELQRRITEIYEAEMASRRQVAPLPTAADGASP